MTASGNNKLKAGDRVEHVKFGTGHVVADEVDGIAEVQFAYGTVKRLSVAMANLSRLDGSTTTGNRWSVEQREAVITRDSDTDAERHAVASHSDPFFDDYGQEFIQQLPMVLESATPHRSMSDFGPSPPEPLPEHWPTAAVLRWPGVPDSMRLVITTGGSGNEFRTAFPAVEIGSQLSMTVEDVHLWQGGLEAQITARAGDNEVTFFDVDYVGNRGWYSPGLTAEVILCGIAYHAAPHVGEDIPIPDDSPLMAILKEQGADNADEDTVAQPTISTAQMHMLVPIEKWDRDDYEFCGRVLSVREKCVLDSPGWLVEVRVTDIGESDEERLDLKILITQRVWEGDSPPTVDQFISGSLWLQGRLWSVAGAL